MKNWKKNNSTNSKPNNDSWLLTYGDMMTLLLCFFVLLHSFSVMDIEKFHAVISSFQHSLGIMDGGKTISPQEMISGHEFLDASRNETMWNKAKEFIKEKGLSQSFNAINKALIKLSIDAMEQS